MTTPLYELQDDITRLQARALELKLLVDELILLKLRNAQGAERIVDTTELRSISETLAIAGVVLESAALKVERAK